MADRNIDWAKAVGRQIRARREALGLGLTEAAKRMGKHHSYLADVEAGRKGTSLEQLQKLARSLGAPVWEIVRDAELGTSKEDT